MIRDFIQLFAIALILLCSASASALPLTWRADWPDAKPVETLVHRGTDIELQPLWRINKQPADTNGWTFTTFCQTNAVGPWFGPMPGAFFSHTNDVGAAFYNIMIRAETPGGAVNYTAFARLRMLDSPGFSPGELPLPAKSIDFADVEVFNAPWTLQTDFDAAISTLNDTKASKADATLTERGVPSTPGFSAWKITADYPTTIEWGETGWVPKYNGQVIGEAKGTLDSTDLTWSASTNPPEAGYNITATRTALPGYQLGSQTDKLLASEDEAEELRKSVDELRQNNSQTRQIVTTWESFLDGSNVVFSITNYILGAYNLDAAKLRILELRDGKYHEVYNSRDEILLHIDNFKTNDFRVATNQVIGAVNAAIENKADRNWGKYTSAGGEAPENTVYMTAPNTVFAGGLEYERVAVGEGTICVLTTHGAPVWTQGDEGTFKFQDDGGTNYFGFAKTDSYTIGANTDGITVQSGIVTLTYNITMSGRPCVWYKSILSSGAWEQLNLPDGSPVAGASHAVTWEQNPDPGTQVCYINVGNAPSGFFRATVELTGDAKFTTNMKADLSGGIICPNTATGVNGVIKPSFNGSSVIWTWSAQ